VLGSILAGCGAAPGLGSAGETEVTLLAAGFVRFENQRIPAEEFVLRIRERIRAAAGDVDRYPAVRILIDVAPPPGRLDRLLRELQSAGVRRVTLG
jgi:hypothetical protein